MRRTWIWTLPLAILATSFWLSSRSTLPFDVSLPHPQDWLAHATEYACLALTLELAARWTWDRFPIYRRHLLLFLLVSLFGCSDEFHQSFVPNRDADVFDWLADTLGGGLGLALSSLPFLFTRRLAGMGWRRGKAERPNPAAPLILVADPHWGEELTGLAEATLQHPEADWLFLGDVFDVWVGIPGMESDAQRSFLHWVAARRHAGRWVGFWLGNREYFLDRHHARFDLMGEGIGGALAAEGLAWEHGDLINGADWKYRLWNLISRSGPVWLLARLLPAASARKLADRLQKALHTSNQAYKLTFPRQAFANAAAEQPGRTFLTGHFHSLEREANGIALPWAHQGRFMVWRDGEVQELSPAPAKPIS
jgi:VanZ family protein/UDP-2,3-diacylglucosamine pyrophosphatase LpxH